jgi:transposase InsO family protein
LIDLFNEKKGRYGYRRLKMLFERRFKLKINIKKIRRIKRKFGLETKIRRRSKFRAIFKAGEEHTTAPNFVQRDFSPNEDVHILSVDVTELSYLGGRKAYMFGVKELKSRMLLHYEVRENPTIDLVVTGMSEFLNKLPKSLRKKTIIHSDQGFQFTSLQFRSLLSSFDVLQSMSRKGNCLDNAPIESFFGHMKDELDFKRCSNFREVRSMVKDYVSYYNFERPQWSLKRKTPAEAGVKLGLVF